MATWAYRRLHGSERRGAASTFCGRSAHLLVSPHIKKCGSGHESAGEIVEIGEGVSQWKVGMGVNRPAPETEANFSAVAVGDRVAIEAGVPCSQPACNFCRSGMYNACPDVVFFSTPPFHGKPFHLPRVPLSVYVNQRYIDKMALAPCPVAPSPPGQRLV